MRIRVAGRSDLVQAAVVEKFLVNFHAFADDSHGSTIYIPNSVHGVYVHCLLSGVVSGIPVWCSEQRLENSFPLRRRSFPLHVAGERTVVSAETKDCKSITITFQEYSISDYFAIHAPIPTLHVIIRYFKYTSLECLLCYTITIHYHYTLWLWKRESQWK